MVYWGGIDFRVWLTRSLFSSLLSPPKAGLKKKMRSTTKITNNLSKMITQSVRPQVMCVNPSW